jgi:hypothetical protein
MSFSHVTGLLFFSFLFPMLTRFLFLWSALQLWKKNLFGTKFLWAPMVQVHRDKVSLYHECYFLIAINRTFLVFEKTTFVTFLHVMLICIQSTQMSHAIITSPLPMWKRCNLWLTRPNLLFSMEWMWAHITTLDLLSKIIKWGKTSRIHQSRLHHTHPGSALSVKTKNARECVLMAYPPMYLALK